LVSEVIPKPCPFLLVWNEVCKEGLKRFDLTPARRVRRRPVAVVNSQAIFYERRPRLVGTSLNLVDVRPQWMFHPVVDDGPRLDSLPRSLTHERVGLHKATQACDRAHFAVNQRDDAAFAHEGAFAVGIVYQQPIEGGRKARLLRR